MAEEIILGAAAAAGSGGTGITSVNGDTSVAQTIVAGSGISVTDVGSAHTIAFTGTSVETLLGSALNKDMQAIATYNIYAVPGGKSAVITRVVCVLASGNPNITGDGSFFLGSLGTVGNNFDGPTGTAAFNAVTNNKCAVIPCLDANQPLPLYAPGDTFVVSSLGGTDACTMNFYAFGFLI